jgi:hypothetical protein
MRPFFIGIAGVALLVFAAPQRAASSGAGQAAPQARQEQTPPPGWSETSSKERDLRREGKHLEVLAMYEQWVARHPDFGEGHFNLGTAHVGVVQALAKSSAPDARTTRMKHVEAAVVHMRHAVDLAGPRFSFTAMLQLIDLYDKNGVLGGLNSQPAQYERLVRESVTRYSNEPFAHALLLELLATKGEPIEAAARAARAAIQEPEGRVSIARELVSKVQFYGHLTPALAPVLLPEASRLIDEVLKMKPGDAEALEVRSEIQKLRKASPR